MSTSPHLWSGFRHIVDRLVPHGVPRPSDRWLGEVERFYLHATALVWFACIGRGAGKNLIGILCDLTELIFEHFIIPTGERHYIVHTSENRTEAEKTLRQMGQYLALLEIPHTATSDTIDLHGELSDRGVKVLAKRIGANSGFRSIGGTTQECAKWSDEGMNPAEEVITSWLAQMVTHRIARKRHFFTPMARDGFAFEGLARGDTQHQIVSQGSTWIFNPSVTEEDCRALSTSDRVFRREYRAEPQAGALSAFDNDAIDDAFRHPQPAGVQGRRFIILDPSSGKKDTFSFGVCGWVRPPEGEAWRPYLRFDFIDGFEGSFWKQIDGEKIADALVRLAQAWGAQAIHSDQREELMLRAAIQRRKLAYYVHPWTATSKPEAVERVRRWLANRTLALCDGQPKSPRVRSELLAFEERITPSGAFTFGARGSGHDDYVALLITAALAEIDGQIVGDHTKPIFPSRRAAPMSVSAELSALNFGRRGF